MTIFSISVNSYFLVIYTNAKLSHMSFLPIYLYISMVYKLRDIFSNLVILLKKATPIWVAKN
ncbi:MAG: hypothetical protein COB56_06580 [Robiginitomaculum sp.]|nr:MAG: hypothetical protein COB56_06580 [Robiginitomaculum sp.]